MSEVRFPNIPESFTQTQYNFFRSLIVAISQGLSSKLDRENAQHEVLLRSPGNKVFSVQVDDSGNLTTTLVQE